MDVEKELWQQACCGCCCCCLCFLPSLSADRLNSLPLGASAPATAPPFVVDNIRGKDDGDRKTKADLIAIIAMTGRIAYSLFNRRIGALLAICAAYWIVSIDCLSSVTPSSTKSPIKEQHQGGSNSNEDNFDFRNIVNNQRRQLQNRPDGSFGLPKPFGL